MNGVGEGRVALVTGAGKGIGKASALALHRLGYRLALAARTETDLVEASRACSGALVVPIDLADPSSPAKLVERVIAALGRLDAIVHCAAMAPVKNLEQTTPELWNEVIQLNLTSTFLLARAAWGQMKEQGGGVIVNLSSQASRDPLPGFAAYAASKAGVNLLGLVLSREGVAHGIRVHTIAPGATETEMLRTIVSRDKLPPEQIMSPEDVAEVVACCVTGTLKDTSGEVLYLRHGSA
jgi:3-oxoacyl-[acyl-carrier protein] reductase